MLFLDLKNFLKIVDAEQGRFTAMPGKLYILFGAGFDMLLDINLQQIIGHAVGF